MNKKGFTLVELLGVIVIIGALITIIAVSVGGVLDTSEIKLTEVQIEKLKEAAKNYYITEGMTSVDFEQSKFGHCVNVNYLIENGYVDDGEVSNFETKKNMLGSIRISYNSKKYEYDYNDDTCSICKPVTNDTKTTGNVPKGNFMPGDEYVCEVKNNTEYHFFVLSTDNDNVNLIMERNIYYNSDTDRGVSTVEKIGNVNWASQEDYNDDVNYGTSGNNNKGPITAMKYLQKATEDWDNVPYMIIDYEDEGNTGNYGYGGIKTEGKTTRITMKDGTVTATIENLKARLPKASEVSGEGLCGLYVKYSCPIWLNDYLGAIYKDEYGNTGTRIAGIEGFWTLSSRVDSPSWAMRVLHEGRYAYGEVNSEIRAGIRPVISIYKEFVQGKDRW